MFTKLVLAAAAICLFTFAGFSQEKTASSAPSDKKADDTTTKSAAFRPTKGQIEKAQAMLKEKKLYTGEADGKYNDAFRTSLKSFQKSSGLKESGSLNKETIEKMGIEMTDGQKGSGSPASKSGDAKSEGGPSAKATADGPKRPAPFRANAEQIKATQKMLKDGKMYAGEETGKLDDPTRESLKKYQEANSLKVTGTLNSATLTKMGIALTDKQKEQVAAQAAYDAAKKN